MTIRIWDVSGVGVGDFKHAGSWECIKIFNDHTNYVETVAFKSDMLASGSWDNNIRLWDMSQFTFWSKSTTI